MKKLLLIASVLFATSAFAEKVGVVDSQRAFFQFSETKKAQQSLEVENEARQKEVALQKEYVALQAKGDKLTEAEKKAFEKKSQDFQAFLNSSQDKLNKDQMAKLKRIEDVYVKALKKVAADGKYDYIFEAEALKIGGEDITDRVLKEMETLKK